MEYTNRAHSLSFLFLTSILIGLNYLGISLADTSVNILCLFLILTIGMSHGSLDNWKGNKLLKIYKIKGSYIFYLIYILVALFVVALWLLLPSVTLMLFLMVASYHFGKEDSFGDKYTYAGIEPMSVIKKSDNLVFFLKGSIIVLAPLMFHFEETLSIFQTLLVENINFFYSDHVRSFLGVLFLISFFAGLNLFIETVCIIALNIFFSPLVAFTVYFCFLHSIRHLVSLAQDLEYEMDKKKEIPKKIFQISINIRGAKTLFRKILPLTLITAVIFILGVFLLTNYYNINDAILKVIFIGLASLTFPHILLEYLIEKNEKRT